MNTTDLRSREDQSLLGPYRVLDLTDEKGFLCGRILGDFGADVIKIEPPGGDPSRNIGPFYHDIPHAEKSLYWLAYNANKRGITLDITKADGKEIFKKLVKNADFVIESFPPGYMERIGLGYNVLSEINPAVVMTSITPFGQTGPWRDHAGSDIVLWALSGYMYVIGDQDRAPLRFSFPQAFLHAGLEAAVGTLVAFHHRQASGSGQWVDVSCQQALGIVSLQLQQYWTLSRLNPKRAGSCMHRSGVKWSHQQRNWECKDGFVCFLLMAGQTGAPSNRAITTWMDDEGLAPDCLKRIDWSTFDWQSGEMSEWDYNQIIDALTTFFKRHTKAELYEGALRRNILLYPCATVNEIRNDVQLKARDFWIDVEHPELGCGIVYPRPCILTTDGPCRIWRRAPLIGEHNREAYVNEMGLSPDELAVLGQEGVI